jgi:hypothetical protein
MSDSFSFAGFKFPRYIPQLVATSYCGTPEAYKRPTGMRHRFKVSTSYYASPTPITPYHPNNEIGFYLDSDFAPGLRWAWCDTIAKIDHTGWFCDEYGDGDKIRGLVMRLPHGRGFLAGHSMGESMSSTVETTVYKDERDAAYAADRLAEICAEQGREYQAEQEVEREQEEQETEELEVEHWANKNLITTHA